MTKETVSLNFDRHFDKSGQHTCCTLWGVKEHTCLFLGVSGRFGKIECCRFPGAERELHRRGDDGLGTIEPSDVCPLTPNKEIA